MFEQALTVAPRPSGTLQHFHWTLSARPSRPRNGQACLQAVSRSPTVETPADSKRRFRQQLQCSIMSGGQSGIRWLSDVDTIEGRSIASLRRLPTASWTKHSGGARMTAAASSRAAFLRRTCALSNRRRNLHPRTARTPYAGAIGLSTLAFRVISFLDERACWKHRRRDRCDHGEEPRRTRRSHNTACSSTIGDTLPRDHRVPVARMQGRRVTERSVSLTSCRRCSICWDRRGSSHGWNVACTAHERCGQGDGAGSVSRRDTVSIVSAEVRSRRCAGPVQAHSRPAAELYDLASDPNEPTNLYGQRAGLVNALTRRLRKSSRRRGQRAKTWPALDSTRAPGRGRSDTSPSRPPSPIDAGARLPTRKTTSTLYRLFTERSRTREDSHEACLPRCYLCLMAVACGGDEPVQRPLALKRFSPPERRQPNAIGSLFRFSLWCSRQSTFTERRCRRQRPVDYEL